MLFMSTNEILSSVSAFPCTISIICELVCAEPIGGPRDVKLCTLITRDRRAHIALVLANLTQFFSCTFNELFFRESANGGRGNVDCNFYCARLIIKRGAALLCIDLLRKLNKLKARLASYFSICNYIDT